MKPVISCQREMLIQRGAHQRHHPAIASLFNAAKHLTQMQALPISSFANRASTSVSKWLEAHQHGAWGTPAARAASIAQRLSPPHKGQRSGSAVGSIAMVHQRLTIKG